NPQCDFELREGNSYLVSLERTFDLRAPFVDFRYSNLSFDHTAGVTKTRDAFEVALLDPEGRPLTEVIAPGRDSFFNLTERSQADGPLVKKLDSVEYDSQTKWVRLNVPNLNVPSAGTAARVKLVFRLINNDGDTGTSVRVIGGHPDLVYRVPGNTGEPVRVTFRKAEAETTLGNELGFFIVEDRTGAVRGQG